jgi:hypothetical protein
MSKAKAGWLKMKITGFERPECTFNPTNEGRGDAQPPDKASNPSGTCQ